MTKYMPDQSSIFKATNIKTRKEKVSMKNLFFDQKRAFCYNLGKRYYLNYPKINK